MEDLQDLDLDLDLDNEFRGKIWSVSCFAFQNRIVIASNIALSWLSKMELEWPGGGHNFIKKFASTLSSCAIALKKLF